MSDDRSPQAPRRWDWNGLLRAVLVVAIATVIGWPLHHNLGLANTNILMLYLVGVLWIATHHSRGAAVVSSVLGVLAFDFCFVPPYYTLSVHDQQYFVTFAVMLMTALLISTLTNRVRAQSQSARIAWERAEAEFLRNTLLSGVSHELRTPLAGITGAASALTDTSENLPPHERREMLQTICTEAERMERLVNNLLDMTRLESGGLALKKEWQPLQEAVGAALNQLDRRLRGRVVKMDLPGDLPLVEVDSVGIQQVLVNLIDNAIEYTPADSPVDVVARSADGQVTIEVADRGPGLPPGTEQRVFEKFFRIRPDQSKRGTGLGLAICRGLVEAHGGQISAANRSDGAGGAVFRITLPRTTPPPFVDGTE
jgi:K+-sensing histidine kinase KdpD